MTKTPRERWALLVKQKMHDILEQNELLDDIDSIPEPVQTLYDGTMSNGNIAGAAYATLYKEGIIG